MHRALILTTLVLATGRAFGETEAQPGVEFFEKKIRPLLASHCYSCHSADTKPAGDLRVDDRNGLLAGGNTGPAIVPGHPEKSLLLQRVKSDAKKQMPKEGDLLTDAEIADLTTWIQEGMSWPREKIPASIGRTRPVYEDLKKQHWAWQPLSAPAVPAVADAAWPASAIDRFVLAKLEEHKLAPVEDADRATLLRRISYDLTGLPPSPNDLSAFLRDTAPDAFARVVDRLLASPQYGERWGRHWLDVARYGESTGPSRNIPYPHAWKYRDYVIDAVNSDLPFDRFIQQQIAGDLLPAETDAVRDRQLAATGFLALGVKDVNQRFKTRFQMDNVDEQIDTVSRSILGLTVSCARCHDHKFDPIPVTDYYALAGIFTSTENCAGVRSKMGGGGLDYYNPALLVRLSSDAPPADPAKLEELQAKVDEAKKAFEELRGTPQGTKLGADGKPVQRKFRLAYERLQGDLLALTDPAARGQAMHGVREAKEPADTEVRIRGEAERIGPSVPRGFLTAFQIPDAPVIPPSASGRLELAQWLTSPQNPLTPRVLANRVWAHLFGEGLVKTVDNFGVKGDVPSHPKLLDYLAGELLRNGWSVKQLIRTIVLSRTYQLSANATPAYKESDPANRLHWRHNPRRLDAEEIRDSMLVTAGRLQLSRPEGSPTKALRMVEIRDNGPEARSLFEQADNSVSRSVYLPLVRGLIPSSLEAFDPVTQSLVSGQRETTTVPTQALYLLNSSFVRQQALALAETISSERSKPEVIGELYSKILGHQPSAAEVARAEAFVSSYALAWSGDKPEIVVAVNDEPKPAAASKEEPANPDDVDRTPVLRKEDVVQPKTPEAAAWMSLVQALYGSAEFRFVR